MKILHSTRTLCLLLPFVAVLPVDGENWPHWRGPNHNAIVNEDSGWDNKGWPPKKELWSTKIGIGSSAVVVADGRLYATGWGEDRDFVYCLDAKTGKKIWHQSYACPEYGRKSEGDKGLYAGPSASPTFDTTTGLLYTVSTDGDLNCWNTRDEGKRVWGINYYEAYDVAQRPLVGTRRLRDYGYTSSVLVHNDWVIAEVGDDEGNLMAFDKKTGRRVWVSQAKDPAGHTGGFVPMLIDGVPCVVVLTIRNLLVVRLDEGHVGETFAKLPWVTDFANSIATPAVHKNSIIVTSEYNQYSIRRIDVSKDGLREVWKKPFASGVCAPLIHRGKVYWCWRGVYCLDFETGKPHWRGGVFGDTASCVATKDDRLIVWANQGDLVLVESANRSPKKYQELARLPRMFTRDVWPHIVFANGRFYCKDRDGNLKCVELLSN